MIPIIKSVLTIAGVLLLWAIAAEARRRYVQYRNSKRMPFNPLQQINRR